MSPPSGATEIVVRAVTGETVEDVAALFATNRSTRNCHCMVFCLPYRQWALGWATGANRVRFENMARDAATPVGLLAYLDGEPVGWCAAGPRSRYPTATSSRSRIMRDRDPAEDDTVWLVPCFFVRVGHRNRGVTHALLARAVAVARDSGAVAIEGWPLAGSDRNKADGYLGRESLFLEAGFTEIARPSERRVVMRYDLAAGAARSARDTL